MLFKTKETRNYLMFVPARLVDEYITDDGGKITLMVPKFKNEKFRNWFIPRRKATHFKIHLDEMGSLVWGFIDGKRTVETICLLLGDRLKEQDKPINQLEERVTYFLTQLHKNEFILLNEASLRSNE
jgi:hypothetical protein